MQKEFKNIISINELYASLRQIGITKTQVSKLLPAWWDMEITNSDGGMWELLLYIARSLSLDVDALSFGEIRPRGAVSNISFKRNALLNIEDAEAGVLVASSIASAVVSVARNHYEPPPQSAKEINKKIRLIGQGSVDFDGLLNYCWAIGIPVIPLLNLPPGFKKMDGAALKIGDRPVIVIARKNNSKSWLSFILAHELAHIALGHLSSNSSIVDVSLQKEATFESGAILDGMEREADDFALDILGGSSAGSLQSEWGSQDTAVQLAGKARAGALEIGCSPGHLILRYAFRTKRWPEALGALKFLTEDFDAQEELMQGIARGIDCDGLSEDVLDLVCRMTGYPHPK